MHLRTQLHHIRFLTRHLPRLHLHLPLDSIKSRCQSAIDRSHYRVRLGRKLHRMGPQVSQCYPGACTTARAKDVADLSACSRRSSVQCFSKKNRRTSSTLNSWSSTPRIFFAATGPVQILPLPLRSPYLGPNIATASVLALPA